MRKLNKPLFLHYIMSTLELETDIETDIYRLLSGGKVFFADQISVILGCDERDAKHTEQVYEALERMVKGRKLTYSGCGDGKLYGHSNNEFLLRPQIREVQGRWIPTRLRE